jgi:hypothetical protein
MPTTGIPAIGQATAMRPDASTVTAMASMIAPKVPRPVPASATVGGAVGLLAGFGLLAIPGIGPVVAAGWLVSTAAGAAAGGATGGLIGALTQAGVSEEDAHVYAEGVRRGGTLVTVRTPDGDRGRVEAILDRSAVNIRDRGAAYRKSGWQRFDPDASPYTADQVRKERDLYRRPAA